MQTDRSVVSLMSCTELSRLWYRIFVLVSCATLSWSHSAF